MTRHGQAFKLWYGRTGYPGNPQTLFKIFRHLYSPLESGPRDELLVLTGAALLRHAASGGPPTRPELTGFLVAGIEAAGLFELQPGGRLDNVRSAIDRCLQGGFLEETRNRGVRLTLTRSGGIRLASVLQGSLPRKEFQELSALGIHREPLSEEPPSATTILMQKRCEDWIKAKASAGEGPFKKDALFEEARRSLEGQLSRRAFERAWAAAAPEDWKKPGRKS